VKRIGMRFRASIRSRASTPLQLACCAIPTSSHVSAKKAQISVAGQIAKLEKLRLKAERAGQLAVAHSCVVSAAKLAGIWVEKSENQTNDNVQYVIRDHPTVEEWARRYCRDDDEPPPPGFDVDRSNLSEFERRQAIKDKLS
jgi:hypothetical protein